MSNSSHTQWNELQAKTKKYLKCAAYNIWQKTSKDYKLVTKQLAHWGFQHFFKGKSEGFKVLKVA